MFATNCPAQMPKWTKTLANRLVIAAEMFGRIDVRLPLATPKAAAFRRDNSDRRCHQAREGSREDILSTSRDAEPGPSPLDRCRGDSDCRAGYLRTSRRLLGRDQSLLTSRRQSSRDWGKIDRHQTSVSCFGLSSPEVPVRDEDVRCPSSGKRRPFKWIT